MRELKFRLVRDNKIVGYEYHLIDPELSAGYCIYHQSIEDYMADTLHSKKPITTGDLVFIFHDQKNQYIGLHDKNGKEIYEGDIVKYMNESPELVEWEEDRAGFIPFGEWYCDMMLGWGEFDGEIIGNIYENPGLLEKE